MKRRYRDEHEARQAIKSCQKSRDVALDFYYCDFCKGYHLTKRMELPWYEVGYSDSVSE